MLVTYVGTGVAWTVLAFVAHPFTAAASDSYPDSTSRAQGRLAIVAMLLHPVGLPAVGLGMGGSLFLVFGRLLVPDGVTLYGVELVRRLDGDLNTLLLVVALAAGLLVGTALGTLVSDSLRRTLRPERSPLL